MSKSHLISTIIELRRFVIRSRYLPPPLHARIELLNYFREGDMIEVSMFLFTFHVLNHFVGTFGHLMKPINVQHVENDT